MNAKNVEALRVALVVATTDKLGPVFTDEFYDRVAALLASRGVLVPSVLTNADISCVLDESVTDDWHVYYAEFGKQLESIAKGEP